jgi:flagellar biosynthesis protein FliQ
MNRIIAFSLVVLAWLIMPIVIVGLTVGLLLGIFLAGSQVLYAYILSELNQRKNNDY